MGQTGRATREPARRPARLTRMRSVLLLVCVAALAAGCGDTETCLPAIAGAAACPAGTIIDASTSDPICLTSSGTPVCRGSDDADCYVCSGSQFDDNCKIKSPQQTVECVHSCSKC
jgi:hypothetical protein